MNYLLLVNRLKNASISELFYRFKEALLVISLKYLVAHKGSFSLNFDVDTNSALKQNLPLNVGEISKESIEKILSGSVFSLNLDYWQVEQFNERWGKQYWSNIHYNDDPVEIRAVLESSRLQHLSMLLFFINGASISDVNSNRIHSFTREQVINWINKNPFLIGPNYISVLECALRIPVFLYIFQIVDGLSKKERELILVTLFTHAWWISKKLSIYSSLGNHTICESSGLIFAGAVFHYLSEGKTWLNTGIKLLEQELSHQILDDGGPAEQSINYHRFVLDLYWLTIDFLESNHLFNCSVWKPRLLAGEGFFHTFLDASGTPPSIGDSDDGHAIAPGISPKRGTPVCNGETTVTFPHSGYTVIRKSDLFLLTFDHGPLGMAPLYNHGHADALSVTLSVNGEKMLIDPGTYRYNGVPEWRRYFKSTRAHNTVTIDGQDQAIQETGFIWSHPYTVELIRKDITGRGLELEARHDGYARLKHPVIHTRMIQYDNDATLIIKDSFVGKGEHEFELNFHLHPDCRAVSDNGIWSIQNKSARLYIALSSPGRLREISGKTDPILGWYSPAYNLKQTCSVLQVKETGTPEQIIFITAIGIDQQPNIDQLKNIA